MTELVVADTMVVSALINARRRPTLAAAYRRLIGDRGVVVSFVTIAELRYGAERAGWGELRRHGLERDLTQFVAVEADDELITICARLRAGREAAGHPLGQKVHEADRWVAAPAIRLDAALVSDDEIFREVPGLDVISADDPPR